MIYNLLNLSNGIRKNIAARLREISNHFEAGNPCKALVASRDYMPSLCYEIYSSSDMIFFISIFDNLEEDTLIYSNSVKGIMYNHMGSMIDLSNEVPVKWVIEENIDWKTIAEEGTKNTSKSKRDKYDSVMAKIKSFLTDEELEILLESIGT